MVSSAIHGCRNCYYAWAAVIVNVAAKLHSMLANQVLHCHSLAMAVHHGCSWHLWANAKYI